MIFLLIVIVVLLLIAVIYLLNIDERLLMIETYMRLLSDFRSELKSFLENLHKSAK
ncbi:MAG: hypothetical protein J5732_02600 [Bacteroidaceae bacterium]|nr:hypothetical protein [Bacteroidaceae bacterium]